MGHNGTIREVRDALRNSPPPPPRRKAIGAPVLADFCDVILARTSEPGLATGFAPLDEMVGGLSVGMHLLIGAPGVGKTSLAAMIASNVASSGRVVFMTGELLPYQLAARVIAQRTGACWRDVERGVLDHMSEAEFRASARDLPLHIIAGQVDGEPPNATEGAFKRLERTVAGVGARFAVVDYVQLFAHAQPEHDIRRATARVSGCLRDMAKRLNIPILALSTMSRASRERKGKLPNQYIGAATESGQLEHDAWTVMALTTDLKSGATEFAARLHVAKSRSGQVGSVALRFDGPTGRFHALDQAAVIETKPEQAIDRFVKARRAARTFGRDGAKYKTEIRDLMYGNNRENGQLVNEAIDAGVLVTVNGRVVLAEDLA